MPIIAKRVLEERRAAAEAACQRAAELAPPIPVQTPDTKLTALDATTRAKRRGHAVKDERGKWQPTGDGPGWCNPPKEKQFKKGNKGGPGRSPKTLSHDTLMRQQLSQKRRVRIDGRERSVTHRELVVMTAVKSAVEGKDRDARKFVLAESARLFGGDETGERVGAPVELNASDALTMEEFEAELRRQIREEVLRELQSPDREDEQ